MLTCRLIRGVYGGNFGESIEGLPNAASVLDGLYPWTSFGIRRFGPMEVRLISSTNLEGDNKKT
jgi:hypothetical protein